MSETKKRKVHAPEFKTKVGLEVLRGMKAIIEIGQDRGDHPVQIELWIKGIREKAQTLSEGKRGPWPMAEHKEQGRLYREMGRLKVDLDWLKKSPGPACHESVRLDRYTGSQGKSGGGGTVGGRGGGGSNGDDADNEVASDWAMRTGRDIARHWRLWTRPETCPCLTG